MVEEAYFVSSKKVCLRAHSLAWIYGCFLTINALQLSNVEDRRVSRFINMVLYTGSFRTASNDEISVFFGQN